MKNAMLIWFVRKPDSTINQLIALLLFLFLLILSFSCNTKIVKPGIHTLERPKVAKVKVKVVSGGGPGVKCETFVSLITDGDTPDSSNFNYKVNLVFSVTDSYLIPSTANRTFSGDTIIYAIEGNPLANEVGFDSTVANLSQNNVVKYRDTASYDSAPAEGACSP